MTSLPALARSIDGLNRIVGQATAWLALFMVLVQFLVVVLRYVFGLGFIWMQESIMYMHGILFMAGAGYTLLHDGHVRVDVFYRDATRRTQAWVNLAGSVLFLIPFCGLILWVSTDYVANSWRVLEGSKETSGIQGIFVLKSVILVFGGLVILQGLSIVARSALTLTEQSTDTSNPDPGPDPNPGPQTGAGTGTGQGEAR